MDLFLLFLLTHENNEIKSPTKIYDFTVSLSLSMHLLLWMNDMITKFYLIVLNPLRHHCDT